MTTTSMAATSAKDPAWRTALAGAQILFVAFGATVLVPLLTGLNPSLALLGAGIGTLVFQLCTRRQVPIYLGSSFAFIAPVIYSVQTWGMAATMGALAAKLDEDPVSALTGGRPLPDYQPEGQKK